MKLLACYDVFSGCAWYRIAIPAHAAARAGHQVIVRQGEAARDLVAECDCLMVQRLWQPGALQAVRHANALGKMTVYDLDDDLWALGPDNPAHAFWKTPLSIPGGERATPADMAAGVIRECQRVTTTTEALAETLRGINPDISIIANHLPDDDWPRLTREYPMTLGWAGALAHRPDVALIADVLHEAAEGGWTVALAGALADWVPFHPRIHHWTTTDINDYPSLIAGFGVGLAPLVDSRFNRAKSDLKVLEYAACSLPVIASPRYADTPARIARNGKDWRKHIRALRDPDLRREEGERMRAWAETRMMSGHLNEWERVWSRT